MSNEPAVSIVVPLYNKQDHIADTIASVLSQTEQDFELIVVNDGSTDASVEAIQPYIGRIVFIDQANSGPSIARNRGIEEAKGRYIAFLDADDLWLPKKLEVQLSYMESHPDVMWSALNIIEVRNGQDVGTTVEPQPDCQDQWVVFPDWFAANTGQRRMLTSGVMIRREVFKLVGGFDPDIPAGQDLDLWVRIALKYPAYAFCHTPLIRYNRQLAGCISQSAKKQIGVRRTTEKHVKMMCEMESPPAGCVRNVKWMALRHAKTFIVTGHKVEAKRILKVMPASWRSAQWYGLWLLSVVPTPALRGMSYLKRRLTHARKNDRRLV